MARTYQLDQSNLFYHKFLDFRFDASTPLLEQLAHLHALAVHMEDMSPVDAQIPEGAIPEVGKASMDLIRKYARIREGVRIVRAEKDLREEKDMADNPESHRCRKCYNPEHLGRNCKVVNSVW